MKYTYLIRYGVMRHVGRFASESPDWERGQVVVVRSHRGTELGDVLIQIDPSRPSAFSASESSPALVLRAAGPDDFERARHAERDRSSLFARCRRVILDGSWPLELIDVERLLDERRIILHYFGPDHLNFAELLTAFRSSVDLDVLLEPVGGNPFDAQESEAGSHGPDPGCGSCGSAVGGCGAGGRCGVGADPSMGRCSDCGVKKLLAAKQPSLPR